MKLLDTLRPIFASDQVTVPLHVEGNRAFIDVTSQKPDSSRLSTRYWVDTRGGAFFITEPVARDLGLRWTMRREEGEEFGEVSLLPKAFVGICLWSWSHIAWMLQRAPRHGAACRTGARRRHVSKASARAFPRCLRLSERQIHLARPGVLRRPLPSCRKSYRSRGAHSIPTGRDIPAPLGNRKPSAVLRLKLCPCPAPDWSAPNGTKLRRIMDERDCGASPGA